ncbi:PP2C family protein-serine/threonine phosphatase [Chloroflexus sp.]|uniref:PP2C family protein-serine/threonine phosphatase n=1 Tax=Chloroflexus sp. TaxID=1904827 RepID=UPI002614DC9E|nr:SpoIIE family protein phosphatase [uncultured Chloroflexus sp.]
MMLVSLLSSQYNRIQALAEAWLAQGAQAFGVFEQGRALAYWPAGQRLLPADLSAAIYCYNEVVGELRLSGIRHKAAQQHLKAEAELIGYMLQLEYELQCMTADLVASQDQQLALYRLTQAMRDLVTVRETLTAVVHEAQRMLRGRAGFATYVSTNGGDPIVVQSEESRLNVETIWRLFWQLQTEDRPLLLSENDGDLRRPPGVHNLLVVPVRVRGMVVASIGIMDRAEGFGTPELKLGRALADQASAQIERILLYQEMVEQARLRSEMDLARRVQTDLLPRVLPEVTGLEIFAYSRPALQVGGDFFDFINLPNHPFIFTIGDVSGKGVSAALLMSMTRTALHSKAQFMPSPTPALVMRQSNEDLYNDFTRIGVFATVFVGQYEVEQQTITYANAGHAPVIYRPRNGRAELLLADNTAIGILPTNHFQNRSLAMAAGDLLIVATDGFSDARNEQDELFGIERLLNAVDELSKLSAREIADGLFDAVDRFSAGHPQDDDQTLIVLKGVEP